MQVNGGVLRTRDAGYGPESAIMGAVLADLAPRQRLLGATCVGVAYFLGSLPLCIAVLYVQGVGALLGWPVLFAAPYVLLPIPAFVAVWLLRLGRAPFGRVSLVALGSSCSLIVLAFCTAMYHRSPPYELILLWPAIATGEWLQRVFEGVRPVPLNRFFITSAVLAGAGFMGALVGSYWKEKVGRSGD